MSAAPYQVDGTEFYARYNEDRPRSQVLTKDGKEQRVNLARSGSQFFYCAVHARITPTRLPPLHAQLEDVDVCALMHLTFNRKAFSVTFLMDNWSGVFGAGGFPLPYRRQMGRPAVAWNHDSSSWRYICVGNVYTFCGSGRLRRVMHPNDLRRTTCMGKRGQFPWQRPCTRDDFGSYKENIERRSKPVLGFDMDMQVDFDAVDWPEFFDADRSSDALVEWLTRSDLVPPEIRELYERSRMRTRPLCQPRTERFDYGQNEDDTVSEYDPELTQLPMIGYSAPGEEFTIYTEWEPTLKPMTPVSATTSERDSGHRSANKEPMSSLEATAASRRCGTTYTNEKPRKKPRTTDDGPSASAQWRWAQNRSAHSISETSAQQRAPSKGNRQLSTIPARRELFSGDPESTPPQAFTANLHSPNDPDFETVCRILSTPVYSTDGTLINAPGLLIQQATQIEERVESQMLRRERSSSGPGPSCNTMQLQQRYGYKYMMGTLQRLTRSSKFRILWPIRSRPSSRSTEACSSAMTTGPNSFARRGCIVRNHRRRRIGSTPGAGSSSRRGKGLKRAQRDDEEKFRIKTERGS